jgi:hypothetical protein
MVRAEGTKKVMSRLTGQLCSVVAVHQLHYYNMMGNISRAYLHTIYGAKSACPSSHIYERLEEPSLEAMLHK